MTGHTPVRKEDTDDGSSTRAVFRSCGRLMSADTSSQLPKTDKPRLVILSKFRKRCRITFLRAEPTRFFVLIFSTYSFVQPEY
jgi:hypothetical protein